MSLVLPREKEVEKFFQESFHPENPAKDFSKPFTDI